MRLASLCEQTGSFESLVPLGQTFSTIPSDLFAAIEHSFKIISWQQNLGSDEMPPIWMWHLDWEIEEWFKRVKIERERKWGNPSSGDSSNDNGELFDDNIYFERMKRGEALFE